jgi:hypothetical protein
VRSCCDVDGVAGLVQREGRVARLNPADRRAAEVPVFLRPATEMKTDTQIRHVTKPGTNLFLELGFEAKRLHAVSRKEIDDARRLKEQLMNELAAWIEENHLKQAYLLNALRR